jgi:glycosyltransferase involved in cell wall biosynthesis
MTRPIRLAVIAASPVYYQTPLYRRLAADGRVDPTVIFSSSHGLRPGVDIGHGHGVVWDVDPLSGFRSVFLRNADRREPDGRFLSLRDTDVVRTLRDGDFDAVWLHGYYGLTFVLAALYQLLRGRPVLFREEGTLFHRRSLAKRVAKRVLLAALYRRAYGLCIGSESRRWFSQYGVRSDRLFSVPYCADNERLQAEAALLSTQREALLRRFGVSPESGPVILFVGRLVSEKQPLLLLEAFRRVRAERACSLLVVGGGPLEDELRRTVRDQQIPDVVFTGFVNQSEIASAYVCADVFALPSAVEPWGMVVNEAMNFALPVVVSDRVGGAADLVVDGVNGFVVSHSSPDELAGRLGELVDSPALRAQFGAASKERVARFTYEAAAEGAISALEHATGRSAVQSTQLAGVAV